MTSFFNLTARLIKWPTVEADLFKKTSCLLMFT